MESVLLVPNYILRLWSRSIVYDTEFRQCCRIFVLCHRWSYDKFIFQFPSLPLVGFLFFSLCCLLRTREHFLCPLVNVAYEGASWRVLLRCVCHQRSSSSATWPSPVGLSFWVLRSRVFIRLVWGFRQLLWCFVMLWKGKTPVRETRWNDWLDRSMRNV